MSARRRKILVINPNSNEAVTKGLDDALEPIRFAGGPEIECRTLKEGPIGIETQAHVESVTLPLSLPGVFAGCLIVFVMALGFYITPALLGGPRTLMIATLISQQAIELLNWPFAGAISFVLLVLSLGITLLFKRLLNVERVVAHD